MNQFIDSIFIYLIRYFETMEGSLSMNDGKPRRFSFLTYREVRAKKSVKHNFKIGIHQKRRRVVPGESACVTDV